jgi:GNAT superfamily N-acetyltransferase
MNSPVHSHQSHAASVFVPSEIHSEEQWKLAGELFQRALRPNLNVEDFLSRRPQLLQDGYRLVAVFEGTRIACVASFTISPHTEMGRELLVHDMATLPEFERQGLARSILGYLEGVAVAERCGRIFVHTRKMASFYVKNGFDEHSTGLVKRLQG